MRRPARPTRLVARFGDRLRGALVQAQAAPGLELLVGVARHPGFGPVVVVGAGGTDAELRNDLAMLIAPVSTSTPLGRSTDSSSRHSSTVIGAAPPLPVDRMAELVHRVSLLAIAVPELQELDLNPVIVDPAGCVVVDVRAAVVDDVVPVNPLRGMRGHVGRAVLS